ncbi:MAG: hypothetical protein ACRD2X_05535, partial [Vicinamibacteraceae bacterium]
MNLQTKVSAPSGRMSVHGDSPARARPLPPGSETEVVHQRFAVEYRYSVHFTRDVFSPENATLLCALMAREPDRLHRLFFVVEAQVARLWPGLLRGIEEYIGRHGSRLDVAAAPVVVRGGE